MTDQAPADTRAAKDVDAAEIDRRRAGARRTALILGAIALAIFIAFLITGVTGRG